MKIPLEIKHSINWNSLSTAFSTLPSNKKKEVLKWNSGFCATNVTLFRRKQAKSSECPGCRHPRESTDHILTCNATGATEKWNEVIENLRVWLQDHYAAPELANAIIEGLQAWRNNHPLERRRYTLPNLSAAVEAQTTIGWKGLLHGFTVIEWEHAQTNYLQFLNKRTTGRRWIAALIRKLWETIWSIWRYRNSLVHEQTNEPLKKITALLNITMLRELHHGRSGLPSKYAYLFRKNGLDVFKISINQKKQWILTVWAARDSITPTHPSTEQRHPLISSILIAWKKRIQQYEDTRNT